MAGALQENNNYKTISAEEDPLTPSDTDGDYDMSPPPTNKDSSPRNIKNGSPHFSIDSLILRKTADISEGN